MIRKQATQVAFGVAVGLFLGSQSVHGQEELDRAQRDAAVEVANERSAAVAAISADREGTIADIVNRLGTTDGTGQFEANLRLASADQLYEISNANSYQEVSNILLFGSASGADTLGVIELAIGQTSQDFVYTPVAPCRVVDTRFGGGGVLLGGTNRAFFVYGNAATIAGQGGNPAGCPSPRGEPRAVHLNVTIVPQAGGGFIKVYPANLPAPNASLVNFTAGVNIANAATVQTFFSLAAQEIRVFSSQNVHVVIDVLGYYHEVDKITTGLIEHKQGGYDIDQSITPSSLINSTTYNNHFQRPQNGNTTWTFNGGEDVLVMCSMQIYKEDAAVSNHIEGSVIGCWRNTSTLAITNGILFQSETDFCFSSTGESDQRSVQVSTLFTNMNPGTYEFGFCAKKGSSFSCFNDEVNYRVAAPKINVIKLTN